MAFLKKINNLEWGWLADLLIIIFISGVVTEANLIWQINYAYPPHADYAHHFLEASAMELRLQNCSSLVEKVLTFLFWPSSYPPGMYWSAYVSSFFMGRGLMSAMMSQMLCFPILVASLYYTVRPKYGVIAAAATTAICASTPFLALGSNSYVVDYPSTAFTALCLCLFFNSDLMQKTNYAVAFGLALGLGCLGKPTTIFFAAPPLFLLFVLKLPQLWPYKSKVVISVLSICAASLFPIVAACRTHLWPPCTADYSSFFPTYKIILIGCAIAWAIGLTLEAYYLWKPEIDKTATNGIGRLMLNLNLAFASFYLLFFPWASANAATMFWRSHHLGWQTFNNLSTLSFSQYIHGLAEGYVGLPVTIITLLGALYCWRKQGTLEERLTFISCLLASLISIIMLSPAVRYILPAIAFGCCFYTAFFRRIPYGYVLALALASLMFWCNIMDSILNPQYKETARSNTQCGTLTMCASLPMYPSTATLPFVGGWQLGPKLIAPTYNTNCAPKLAAIFIHETIINANPAESLKIGLQTWANFHRGSIVPVLVSYEDFHTKETVRLEQYRNILNLKPFYPEQAEKLIDIMDNRQDYRYDYVIDVTPLGFTPAEPAKIRRLLTNDSFTPIYFATAIQTKEYKVTLYSLQKM